jgi:hypothetical protein
MSGEVCQTILIPSNIDLKLIYSCIQTGAQALAGREEYIKVKLFEAVDHDRKITGKGMSIMIYDPQKDMSTPPYWEHNNTSQNATGNVPAGFKVRVIGATVRFTRE